MLALAATAVAAPAIAQSMPEMKWRLTSSFPEIARHAVVAVRRSSRSACAEATDNKFQIQVFAAGEIVPGLAGARRGPERHRRDVPYRVLLLFRQGSDLCVRHCACRSDSTRVSRTPGSMYGGGMELINEFYKKFNVYAHAGRQYRRARWVAGSARRSRRRRPQGIEDADRRFRRPRRSPSSASCRSRSPAAKFIRPWKRARSTRPNGSALTTTRSSASTRSRSIYYYPGWWEGGTQLHQLHQHRQVERAAEELSVDRPRAAVAPANDR